MAATQKFNEDNLDVEYILEQDGRYTAKSHRFNVASFGETKSDALESLIEAVEGFVSSKDDTVPKTGDTGELPWE